MLSKKKEISAITVKKQNNIFKLYAAIISISFLHQFTKVSRTCLVEVEISAFSTYSSKMN